MTALNYLLSTDGYHSKVGDSMVVFWTDSGDVDDVSRLRKMMGNINEKDQPLQIRMKNCTSSALHQMPGELQSGSSMRMRSGQSGKTCPNMPAG